MGGIRIWYRPIDSDRIGFLWLWRRARARQRVVGVALADAALGLRQVMFVFGTLHDSDRKGRQRKQEGVKLKALLLGEGREVLENLVVSRSRSEDLLDLVVPEHQGRASADDR
jgi:hypothetical protein